MKTIKATCCIQGIENSDGKTIDLATDDTCDCPDDVATWAVDGGHAQWVKEEDVDPLTLKERGQKGDDAKP